MAKILFLARLYSPHIGGVENHVSHVVQELKKKGHQITIFTEQYEANLSEYETSKDVEIYRIPPASFQSKRTLWRWISSHKRIFEQADVVHVHDVFWWTLPLILTIKSKLFITFHGWEGKYPLKKTAILQRRLAARLAKGIIQVGEYIEKWYGTKPDFVTYGGVELPTESTLLRLKKTFDQLMHKDLSIINSTKHQYTCAFIGRLSTDNDVDKVIDLFIKWKAENPKARFVFVGDGELRRECELVGKVTGFVENPYEYIQNSQMVCAASYLSILESQAMGKMVCSFYSNPLKRDYLMGYPQSSAMIISKNSEDVFEQIKHIQSLREMKAEIQLAQQWAKGQTWEQVTSLYEDLWKKNSTNQSII